MFHEKCDGEFFCFFKEDPEPNKFRFVDFTLMIRSYYGHFSESKKTKIKEFKLIIK